ncbi:MAG: cyanophycinase [Ignavibacteriae bacterium]|nr:cyanophycinase [Ignavibacteriota bacterium]
MSENVFGGRLIIIGGAEDKYNERHILRRFLAMSGGPEASILIVPVASEFPEVAAHVYTDVFTTLGAGEVRALHVATREEALKIELEQFGGVTGVFISGGDQARLTSKLGGTPFTHWLKERAEKNEIVLAGSSAGAAGMSRAMIVRGKPSAYPNAETIRLSPGLGLLGDVIIDQHFSQRNRLSRLITAVSYNPANLGIGIDEDTAIVLHNGLLDVIGSGTVTVLDASGVTFSDIAEHGGSRPFALCNLKLHILNNTLRFDMERREPLEYLSDYTIG